MIKKQSRKFTSEFKAKVAIEVIKGCYTLSELSKRFDLDLIPKRSSRN